MPSEELIDQWKNTWAHKRDKYIVENGKLCSDMNDYIAIKASQWGADQELDAICEFAGQQSMPEKDRYFDGFTVKSLKLARRPKPPSEKEQALEALERIDRYAVSQMRAYTIHDDLIEDMATIRRALGAIPTDTQ